MTRTRLPRLLLLVIALLVGLVGLAPGANAAKVHPSTSVKVNHSSIRLGKSVAISGKVSPNARGHRAALQQRSHGHWKTISRKKLNSASRYRFSVRPKSTGTKRYRVWVFATKQTKRSVSKSVRVSVKAKSSGGSGGSSGAARCTPGYSPCIPPTSDADCAGGSGDGPTYVQGPVYVTGSDPYDLDRDGDGVGCDS